MQAKKPNLLERFFSMSEVSDEPEVSVILLAYNSLENTTKPCVSSLLSTQAGANYELIIVDNASDDGTQGYLEKIAKGDPKIRLALNSSNLGFSGGNNVGLKLARGKHIILLNSDTLVTNNWIKKLIAPMNEDPAVGMVGPMTNSAGNEQCLNFPGITASNFEIFAQRYCSLKAGSLFQTEKLGFFCVAIRKRLIDEIGYLDEDYTVGMFEDDDYCARARKANYTLVIREDCFIFHQGSYSFKKLSSEKNTELFRKNREVFQKKHGLWRFSDIASAIWSRLNADIQASFMVEDSNAQHLLNPKLQIMTNAIEQVKTNEKNYEVTKDFDLMQAELNEKNSELMKLSEWATSLNNENQDLKKLIQALEQKTIIKLLRRLRMV